MTLYIIWDLNTNKRDSIYRGEYEEWLCDVIIDIRFRYGASVEKRLFVPILEKIIPGIPLDPTLPILQAGYIQDRARKRYRQAKL